MQLLLSTWLEIDAYLKRCTTIIMPIGSTEQHGPNGLIGTDAICAKHIARCVGEATGLLVAPTISVGMAAHHMAFPGTISHSPSVLIDILREQVMGLAAHGFRSFYFVNSHGGNIATLNAALSEIHSLRWNGNLPAVQCRVANWWDAPEVAMLSQRFYGEADGAHATASEIAITRYLYPKHAKEIHLDPPVAPGGAFQDANDLRRRFPDGRIGSNPALAKAEHGEQLFRAAVNSLAELFVADASRDDTR